MEVSELRKKVEEQRDEFAARDKSKIQFTGKGGPISITPVLWLVEAIEAQDARIAELERKLAEKSA